MNWEILINGKKYPLTVEPVEYMHGSHWVCTNVVQIPEHSSDDIDRDLGEKMPGFVADCIHYALIDGWTASGLLNEDDQPIQWTVLLNGRAISRDQIDSILNHETIEE